LQGGMMEALEVSGSQPHAGEHNRAVGPWRVVVESIGSADAGLVGSLAQVLPWSESRLAQVLYQTPSVLFDGTTRELADRVAALLNTAGVQTRVQQEGEPFEAGAGDHEVALVIDNFDNAAAVAALVARVVGCSVQKAVDIICTSPSMLMGSISRNTALAFQQRLAAVGAHLDISCTESARYDLFVEQELLPVRRMQLERVLKGLDIALSSRAASLPGDGRNPLVAVGLDAKVTHELWYRLKGNADSLRVINQDFMRFDVRLLALSMESGSAVASTSAASTSAVSPASAELTEFLVSKVGMPEELVSNIGEFLPLTLFENVTRAEVAEHLAALCELGVQAEAVLLCFQGFDLELSALGDERLTLECFKSLGKLNESQLTQLQQGLTRLPLRIEGPFSKNRACWLSAECARAGTQLSLLSRE
jgi:hypothetical protein